MNRQEEFQLMLALGGTPLTKIPLERFTSGIEDAAQIDEWNFGVCVPHYSGQLHLSVSRAEASEKIKASFAPFVIQGRAEDDPKKVILSDVLDHPLVLNAACFGGKRFSGFHQLTGSCVGSGSGNKTTLVTSLEVVIGSELEEPIVPWWPYAYGRGRLHMGDHSQGEGSNSSFQCEAEEQDGIVRCDLSDLPKYTDSDGLTLTNGLEMTWSDGDSPTVTKWLDTGKQHVYKKRAMIRNSDDARECIRTAKLPFHFCGNWGGQMQCQTQGTPPVLLNRRSGVWNHNETCIAWYDHPTLGELFGIWNQWGLKVHGSDPAGLPPGAYWIVKKDMDYQASQGDCIVSSAYDGFPARKFSWAI